MEFSTKGEGWGVSDGRFPTKKKKNMGLKHWILPDNQFQTHLFFFNFWVGGGQKSLSRRVPIVTASRAPVLKLSVVKGFKQRGVKVLKSSIVEKLVVEGPCTLNLVPVMSKLKVVEVKLDPSPLDSCTHWKSKQDDRNLHRHGLCCVNFGTMFEKCPNLEEFMGLEVGSVPKDTFNKWNSALKKKFYQNYLHQGGTMEFKVWVETRWFTKRQVVFPAPY